MSRTRIQEAGELMKLAIEQAPALRAAGVTSFAIEGLMSFAIGDPIEEHDELEPEAPPKPHIDPMRDASTYPGGRIPGFTREDEIP